MQTTLTDIPTGDALPMLNAYKYDQLNRLLEARSYETGLSSNVWSPSSYGDEYLNTFTYDANGNILTQNRHLRDGTQTDELTYNYLLIGGNLVRNRLYHVNDAIAGATYVGDLEDQGGIDNTSVNNFENNNNYRYDEEGRLIQDLAEGIQEIVWRVDGKVKAVYFTTASEKNSLEFDYDAFGRRIAKHVYLQDNSLVRSTYYILDAQGNQLSTYEHSASMEGSPETYSFELAERVIYGSSRLGINVKKVDMLDENPEEIISLELGNKLFEMSNHLGNVLTVINDVKIPQSSNSVDVDGYLATIVSTADYSPFGVLPKAFGMDGRTVSAESYRYGFNGMEKDDEMKGAGNSYTTEFRQYDTRLGRWLSLDPKMAKYPYQSPFAAFNNNPIFWIDPFGDDPPPHHSINYEKAPTLDPFDYRGQFNFQTQSDSGRKCYLNNVWQINRSNFTKVNNSNIYYLQKQKSREYYALYYVPAIRTLSDGSEVEDVHNDGFYVMRKCESVHRPLQIGGGFSQARDLFSSSVVPVRQMTDPKYRSKEQMTFTVNTMEQEIQNEINQTLNNDPNIDKSSLQVVSLLVHINADLPQDYKEVLMSKIKSHFEVGQNIQVNFRQLSSRNMGANGDTQVCRTFINIEYDRYEEVDCE